MKLQGCTNKKIQIFLSKFFKIFLLNQFECSMFISISTIETVPKQCTDFPILNHHFTRFFIPI